MKTINNNSNQSNQSIKQFKNQNTMKTTKSSDYWRTKITILAAMFFIATISSYATVRTVSNDPAGGSQFNSLQSAYDAAVNGDTLLLAGTNITYNITGCNQHWSKALTVIGIGFNPQKQNAKRSMIGNTACQCGHFFLGSGASGSKFYGIEFSATGCNEHVFFQGAISNVLFESCKFAIGINFGNQTTSNIAFRNCIFDWNNNGVMHMGGGGNVVSNVLISNCVFDGYIEGNGNPFVTMIIDHCIFLDGTFSNLHYATITNNIFMNSFPGGTGNSTYLNNICRVAGTFPPAALGGNTGSGNINATDPLLVSVPASTFYSTSHDYHLQAGSPAIGTAADATDIGVHGGTSLFSEQGEVLINPIMRQVIINNATVAPNGTLNVNIVATKPDDN